MVPSWTARPQLSPGAGRRKQVRFAHEPQHASRGGADVLQHAQACPDLPVALADPWRLGQVPADECKQVRVRPTLVANRGLPKEITVNNGTEFYYSKAMDAWAHCRGVKLDFIRPGRPMENGYIESFNGKLRNECLNAEVFMDLVDARRKLEAWRRDYNEQKPHPSIGNLTPVEYAASLRAETGKPGEASRARGAALRRRRPSSSAVLGRAPKWRAHSS